MASKRNKVAYSPNYKILAENENKINLRYQQPVCLTIWYYSDYRQKGKLVEHIYIYIYKEVE